MHSLEGKDRLLTVILRAESLAVFDACIQNIDIEKWPLTTTVCGRILPAVKSFLDSFTFPGLAVFRSCVHPMELWSLARRQIYLSNAAISCLVVANGDYSNVCFEPLEVPLLCLGEGQWIVIIVYREFPTRIIKAPASIVTAFDFIHGWLITGDRRSVVHGFKQLFRTLRAATSLR